MNSEDYETFLAVARTRNMAKAAETLFVGQGTVSARIQKIEQELGCELFIRARGMRTIHLTPEAEYLLPIMREQFALDRRAHEVGRLSTRSTLRVSATEVLNGGVIGRAYQRFAQAHPEIRLHIETHHAKTNYELVASQEVDVAFAFHVLRSDVVSTQPLYRERWGILCHADDSFAESKNLADLDPVREIRRIWSADFEIWHHEQLPQCSSYLDAAMVVGSPSLATSLIACPGLWTVVSGSVARLAIERCSDLYFVPFETCPPPSPTANILRSRKTAPWSEEAVDALIKTVCEIVEQDPDLELI